jgi:asparagine synthase (glutamine-hydrolysing)
MCGIAGLFRFGNEPVAAQRLRRMLDSIVHRGPDDQGTHEDGPLAMGMRRLSIIDIGGGHQPIHNEDRTVWVVFNGEIYNFRRLRTELEQQGHCFYTNSDTEVIVHLYEQWGEAFIERLNGMFSIALWDSRARKLVLARDRVGEKQLFYANRAGTLIFGSELKCVMESGLVDKRLDPEGVDDYFTYLYCPAPRTLFEGVSELPPATILVADEKGIRSRRYWQLRFEPEKGRSDQEWIERFRERFRQSVRSRLESDVPLGALLSGGVDSSAVVAEMAQAGGGPVNTFCIGYDGDASYYDERRYAATVARQFGTNHHELVVSPDLREVLPKLVDAFDQPFADSSAIANYYVFRETRRHVKVVLTGLGGDEVAAGYERHLGLSLHGLYRRVPTWLREGLLSRAVRALPEPRSGSRMIERLKRFVAQGGLTDGRAYANYIAAFDRAARQRLFSVGLQARLAGRDSLAPVLDLFEGGRAGDLVSKALLVDTEFYLPGDLLTLTDRMSMASSIEARAPFIDPDLMEFMARVPSELKLRRLEKKFILKRAFEGTLPREILYRQKRGFTLPLTLWLRKELNGWMREQLADGRMARTGLFQQEAINALIEEHTLGRNNHHSRLWALLMFSAWHARHFP